MKLNWIKYTIGLEQEKEGKNKELEEEEEEEGVLYERLAYINENNIPKLETIKKENSEIHLRPYHPCLLVIVFLVGCFA